MQIQLQRPPGADKTTAAWIEQQYTGSLIWLCIIIIVFHPAFHYVLELLPNLPPDSLATRLVSVSVAAALLTSIWRYPLLRQYSPWFQIVNAGTMTIVTHEVVLNSGNHPMYLAASLTAVYAAQLSFVRLREWLITVAIIFTWYLTSSIQRGFFADLQGFVPLFFYISNYIIATGLVVLRHRLQQREIEGRLALQQKNDELHNMTDALQQKNDELYDMTDALQQKNDELHDMTEQLQGELALARTIQQSLLPPAAPTWPSLDTLCYSQPAREVGGDFYSYYQFNDSRVALAVGDVSGKGASAALLMATSLSLFNTHVEQTQSPSAFMANLDRNMLPYTQPQRQNCALTYLELDHHTLQIVNAGGIPPFIRRRSGQVEWPEAWGFALGQGLGAQTGYQLIQVAVEVGDLIVLVSDGVVEAKNRRGQLWGFDRLQQAIVAGPSRTAQAMIEHLCTCVQAFVGTTEPHDDMTIVVVRVCEAAPGLDDDIAAVEVVPVYAA